MGQGPDQITATTRDAAGNSTVVTRSIQLDSVAPTVALAHAEAGLTVNRAEAITGAVQVTAEAGATVTLVLTGTQNVVTKTISGTGSVLSVGLSASEIAQLGQGAVGVVATATDAAGNQTSAGTGGDFILSTVLPQGTTSTLKVNGTYVLQAGDFGFSEAGGMLSAVKITSGSNIYLNNSLLPLDTVVSVSDIVGGHLEWRPTANSTSTTPIGFQVIDGAGNAAVSENVLTLSRTVSSTSTLDSTSGSRFEKVAFTGDWAEAYADALAKGGHLATLDTASQYTTGMSVWNATPGVASHIGLEQSSDGAEPGGGWHWITGQVLNTAVTPWMTAQPDDSSDVGGITAATGLNDLGGTASSYIIEYENAAYTYRGLAGQADILNGTSSNDVLNGMGGADTVNAGGGHDRIMVPDLSFITVNGGAGFDVLEFTSAMTIDANALIGKVIDIEALNLGAGAQNLTLSYQAVVALSTTTDSLSVAKDASDTVSFAEGVGTGANQWHALDTRDGMVTYQYYDALNHATAAKVMV